jgi:archaellum biogenesis ATPase FlaH
MPTFSSIDLHPDLRRRLVTQNKHQQQHTQLIKTPQALLSRNPKTLHLLAEDGTSSRPIAPEQVRKLRVDVATALCDQTKTARYVRRVQHALSQRTIALDTTTTTTPAHQGETSRAAKRSRRSLASHESRSCIPGALSALQLLQYESMFHAPKNDMHDSQQQRQRKDWTVVSTGCQRLDAMLASPSHGLSFRSTDDAVSSLGGIPFGSVTQFSGPPASGKTQLALHIAVTGLSNGSLHKVWYICSGGTCTPMVLRLSQLCHSSAEILQRVVFGAASSDYDVLKHLAALESHLEQEARVGEMEWKPIMLILDSCSGCLAAASGATRGSRKASASNSLLYAVGATIRRLTSYNRLATVLFNGSVSSRGFALDSRSTVVAPLAVPHRRSCTKPALGHRWNSSVADICVWLEPSHRGPAIFDATLERHAFKECKGHDCNSASMVIASDGVHDLQS